MNKSKYLSILNEIKEQGGSELGDNPNENVLIIDGLNTFIRVFVLYQLLMMMGHTLVE